MTRFCVTDPRTSAKSDEGAEIPGSGIEFLARNSCKAHKRWDKLKFSLIRRFIIGSVNSVVIVVVVVVFFFFLLFLFLFLFCFVLFACILFCTLVLRSGTKRTIHVYGL